MASLNFTTKQIGFVSFIAMSIIAIPIMIVMINHPLVNISNSSAASGENAASKLTDLQTRLLNYHPQIPIADGRASVATKTDANHTLSVTINPTKAGSYQDPFSLSYVFAGGSTDEYKAMSCNAYNTSDTKEQNGQSITIMPYQTNRYLINGTVTFLASPRLITQNWVIQCVSYLKDQVKNTNGYNVEWLYMNKPS